MPEVTANEQANAVEQQAGAKDSEEKKGASQPACGTTPGIKLFVGVWHRSEDLVLMAEISPDGSWAWGPTFRCPHTIVSATGENRLEIDMDGDKFVAKYDESTRCLLWDDGEIWVQGFDQYAEQWFLEGRTGLFATIHANGQLSWAGVDEIHVLCLRGSEGLGLKINGTMHIASLSTSKEGGGCHKRLYWSDGAVWTSVPPW